jgi:hypothetical protein
MEKVIIFGIILITVILLIKRINLFLKGDKNQGCDCSSSGSCWGSCDRQKEESRNGESSQGNAYREKS